MSALACLARMAYWSPAARQRAASRCGRESAAFSPGLYPDWFSRVEGSYYAHLDAFVCSLGGEEVADLPGLLDGLRAQAIAEAAVLSLQQGQFVSVEPLA